MTGIYFDASALVKLGIVEPESKALRRSMPASFVAHTSVVGRVEFERAIRRCPIEDPDAVIGNVLDQVDVIPFNAAIAGLAAAMRPTSLRSVDAIHLATMRAVQEDLAMAYCYDERLAVAAAEYGIPVSAPR